MIRHCVWEILCDFIEMLDGSTENNCLFRMLLLCTHISGDRLQTLFQEDRIIKISTSDFFVSRIN